ncbi:N-acetylmuramoyl-L-alanine amidase [Geomonas paludis]|uniref:N-acetylmuramoyl-L-alanine amidase n=1 Tax=Geomonas paludis TaxID=2740185 RepID=A0A6V8MYY9_9BACT|nr:N-acetylmuramoyl-L-alanine amidase [Geomonas paludis]UPU35143.1 N-acetylmuramoyl-L-alanine amidase [Geomonas paludis]GFO65465.1 hypothetical protein GMPD_33840 [Geomonas paludis]
MTSNGKFNLLTISEFDQWLRETCFNRKVQVIQNHHTKEPSYRSFTGSNHFDLLCGMEHYHVVERGFSEIAQNLTTFPDGTVALCRPLEKIPAGIKGANQAGICIENLGDFDSGRDTMTQAHRQAIIEVNALLCREFRLTPTTETIVYHHWYDLDTGRRTGGTGNTKSCPGTAFFGGNSVDAAQTGFIPEVLTALSAAIPAPLVTSALRSAMVNASLLNVRVEGRIDAPIVMKLQKGVLVQVYEDRNGWCRIHPAVQQWVCGDYLL